MGMCIHTRRQAFSGILGYPVTPLCTKKHSNENLPFSSNGGGIELEWYFHFFSFKEVKNNELNGYQWPI